eukprot:GHVL01043353.1.p1 GENE.GHVL01043353.1~~GHVL01043353.1.p1  ORF type:complete len:380 (-),score=59.39 GHVL01043353.1:144-1283(-)
MEGILRKGFTRPSKIQEVALPLLLEGRNLIGQAQNGSGKTAAFALGMLLKIERSLKAPQALCLCPTRELCKQTANVISELSCACHDVDVVTIVPGTVMETIRAQIVVGTCGKVKEMLQKRLFAIQNMMMIVLDEADQMISETQQGPQFIEIRKFFTQRLQCVMFSATWPDNVRHFAKAQVPNADRITVKKEQLTLDSIHQMYMICNEAEKYRILTDLYGALSIGQSVVFVNTKKSAHDLSQHLRNEGYSVSLICGTQNTSSNEKMDVNTRDKVMAEFREGSTKVLVATDVIARGIDVPAVTFVVNCDIPVTRQGGAEMETYLHRIGRTGRFGLKGISLSLVTSSEIRLLEDIRDFYQCTIEECDGDIENLEKKLAELRN